MSAASVKKSTVSIHETGAGLNPSAALHAIRVGPIPIVVTKKLLERKHYLHSMPGATELAFGMFVGHQLMGALTLGAGPSQAYHLVQGAEADNCLTLTRFWLSDELPRNSESRVISIVLRNLRKSTTLKFLISYADPYQKHVGTIYQATGWLYTGLSEATPRYDLGDGKARHSRSVSQVFGTHSISYFSQHGLSVKLVSQAAKHRYLYFLDPEWHSRLSIPVLPYPKLEVTGEDL